MTEVMATKERVRLGRPNKKISVFWVTGLKYLGRVDIFFMPPP